MRDGQQPREGQPYQRDQQQPREHRDHREHRPQPQYQPQPQQPAAADNGGVDRLPSFITGPQPQINGGYEGNNGGGGDRFPRRRRRPHGGPRPEGMGQQQSGPQGDDFNPGNE
jgi:hypothetical protein